MSYPTRDWLTRTAAQDLARQIEVYWASQGKKVRTRIEEFAGGGNKGPIYSVRSDMLAGSPKP